MASGFFEIDTASLHQGVSVLQEDLSVLRETNSMLQDELAKLSGMWSGPARDAFHTQFQKDCDDFGGICEQLKSLLTSMTDAGQRYEACDTEVRGVIDAVKV